ncbi:hypothetical protein AAFF_G00220280 [Aldrovandia affinis]|uniref:Guanine nucleotide-binding protein subunit gamma n=1 Tax=Aldrovandia affinis TaxID=143900 RepID=A0AAD7RIR2_9TELE|nr:hypothetical protein AAFF_G00220280 [Aldrovandia affinis]
MVQILRCMTTKASREPLHHRVRMARDMSDKDVLKMELDQLKKEVKNERLPMSTTAKDLVEWVDGQYAEDPLIKGVPEEKNPFKEKGGCIIT